MVTHKPREKKSRNSFRTIFFAKHFSRNFRGPYFFAKNVFLEILSEIVSSKALKKGIINVRVEELWKKVMGENVEKYTQKVEFKNSTLYVYLKSSVLRNELSYGTDKIISLLNNEIGENTISKIIFT